MIKQAKNKDDLSDVALMWMIEQAKNSGLEFEDGFIKEKGWDFVTDPLLHDSVDLPLGYGWDRDVIYEDGTRVRQKDKNDGSGMSYKDTLTLIDWNQTLPNSNSQIAGSVNLVAYCQWLNTKSYFKEAKICN